MVSTPLLRAAAASSANGKMPAMKAVIGLVLILIGAGLIAFRQNLSGGTSGRAYLKDYSQQVGIVVGTILVLLGLGDIIWQFA